ncbi:MAG: hypothetical protein KGS72_22405 [Cyanobacteria bacterium REEB67]|nr:hypothetical protein [Cyanobacteria bacterium REEB67]
MQVLLLITQVASTWFMVGLIWFVQVVHYPLYDRVGASGFVVYERDHCALTTLVVAPAMVVELFSAALLVVARPKAVGLTETLVGLGLALAIWLLTLFIADNYHGALSTGFSVAPYKALIFANGLRTALWTIRGLVVSYMCWKTMQS